MFAKIHLLRWRSVLKDVVLLCLVSWSLGVQAQEKSSADYFVRSLPGQPDGPLLKMHAGHITVNPEHHGNLFFWHIENRHIANRRRTVIWLNGGPGCSSMDGALIEVGPYRVREGGKLEYRDGSWDEFANILFVDNPVGTGYSYVDTDSYLHELQEMSDSFIVFLEKFFQLFPQYDSDDLYIAGESYAGQHIPYIARAIVDRNKDPVKRKWNLNGLLIGNGWISPSDQYLAYLPYAYKEGLIQGGTDMAKRIEGQQTICAKKLNGNAKDNIDTPECEKIMTDILDFTKRNSGDQFDRCLNMYDVRLRDDDSCGMNWPPDLEHVTPYLRKAEVKRALNVDADKVTGWQECSGAVSRNFRATKSKPAIQLLPDLLKEMPIVLFSGEKDLICNHLGTEGLIGNMEWNGGKGFETSPGVTAPRRDWEFEGEPAGFYQEARNLTYILFYNSSHMVPFDYPRRSRSMLDRFMDVDITSIGGKPTDSRVDGEKDPETSVGGHSNATHSEEQEEERLQEAKWEAYQRSGEVVLVVVIILAAAFGWWVWRGRQKRPQYQSVRGDATDDDSQNRGITRTRAGLEGFRQSRDERDIEAATYHESHLKEDAVAERRGSKRIHAPYDPAPENGSASKQDYESKYNDKMEGERYSIGQGSSSEEEGTQLETLSTPH